MVIFRAKMLATNELFPKHVANFKQTLCLCSPFPTSTEFYKTAHHILLLCVYYERFNSKSGKRDKIRCPETGVQSADCESQNNTVTQN